MFRHILAHFFKRRSEPTDRIPSLAETMRPTYAFNAPSDAGIGAAHDFPSPEPLRKNEASEHYRLATELVKQEHPDFEEAVKQLQLATQHRHDFADAYLLLGDIKRYSVNPAANLDEAKQHYTQALSLEANHPKALLGSLYLALELGNVPEARQIYERMIRDSMQFMKSSYIEGFEADSRPPLRIFYGRRRDLHVLKHFGDAMYVASDVDKAIEYFRQILEMDSNDIETRIALALLLQRHGAAREAITIYRDVLRSPKKFIGTSLARYRIWLANDSFELITEFFGGALAGPISAGFIEAINNNLAVAFLAERKWDDATRILKTCSRNPAAFNNWGVTAVAAGNLDIARQCFESAVGAYSPMMFTTGDLEASFNLALLETALGRASEATIQWNSCLKRRHHRMSRVALDDMCLSPSCYTQTHYGGFIEYDVSIPIKIRQRYTDAFDQKWVTVAKAAVHHR